MTVSTETASVSYAGNGATTVFAVSFYFLENSHIRVVLRTSAGVESTKALTADYTVANAGTNPSTATVTCVSFTPASGETLRIVRDPPLTQDTDYIENDAFPAETHEKALDKLTMIAQAVSSDVSRALKWPETSSASALLPDPASNGNRFLATNSGGTAVVFADSGSGSLTNVDYKFASVAAMSSQTGMANNAIAMTLGYYTANDGGHGTYRYDSASVATVNGGTVINAAGGAGRWLLTEFVPNIKQFGVTGDGSDETARLAEFISYMDNKWIDLGGLVITTQKQSPTNSTLLLTNGTLKLKNSTNDRLLDCQNPSIVVFYMVTFDGNHQNQSTHASATVGVGIVGSVHVKNCVFQNGQGNVLDIDSVDDFCVVENNLFKDGKEHTGTVNENSQYISVRTDASHLSDEPQFVKISGNTFIGITPSVAGRGVGGIIAASTTAASATQGHKLFVDGNTFYNCGQDAAGNKIAAISIYRRGPYSQISENKIFGGDERGIDIQGSNNVIVDGNIINATTGTGIVFATRDTTKDCANVVITNNVVTGISAAWGIDCQGYQGGSTAKNITVANNIISDCKYSLLISDYLDSIIVSGNTFNGATTTSSSADEQAVSILGTRGTSGTFKNCGLVFSNNQINNSANSTLIQDMAYPVSITGNVWNAISTSKIALSFTYSSSSLSITANSFNECGVFTSVQQCSGNVIENSNSFNDSNTTIRAVTFKNNTGNILCDGNIFKSVANDIVEFSSCSGRNMLSNNVGPASSTVRVATSTVTQTNNLFT